MAPNAFLDLLSRAGAVGRRRRAVRWIGWGTLASAATITLALALDRYLILSAAARVGLTILAAAVPLATLAGAAAILLRPRRPLQAALEIERAPPGCAGAVLSSAELALSSPPERGNTSPELLDALEQRARATLAAVDLRTVYPPRPAVVALVAGGLGLATLLGLAVIGGDPARQLLARLASPLSSLPRPTTTVLAVTPGDTALARGSDLSLRATRVKGLAGTATLWQRTPGGAWAAETLSFNGDVLDHTLTAVRKPFQYRVAAGDFETPVYTVTVREAPRPLRYRLTCRPPAYTGAPSSQIESPGGDVVVLAGTAVAIEVEASEPLRAARMEVVGDRAAREARVDGASARFDAITVDRPGAYQLTLEALDGVRSVGAIRHVVRPLLDRPPHVEIVSPGGAELEVEPESRIELEISAGDDVGLQSLELGIREGEAPARWNPLSPDAVRATVDVAALGLLAGTAVAVNVRARDALGQEALAAEKTLRIALAPGPPQGPDWPAPLETLAQNLAAVIEEWSRLFPRDGEPPAEVHLEPAIGERLGDAAEEALSLIGFVRSAAERALEVGRSIAVPSPNRGALEDLAFELARVSREECTDLWLAASAAAEKIRSTPPGQGGTVSVAALHVAHRAAAARLQEALQAVEALRRESELESLVERAFALELELRGNPTRGTSLAVGATILAAALERAAAGQEDLEGAARALVERVAPALTTGSTEATARLRAVRDRLEARLARARAAARETRARLDRPERLSGDLESLRDLVGSGNAGASGQRALAAVLEEQNRVAAHEYADLETTADLALAREILERILAEELSGNSQDATATTEARELAEFVRSTAGRRRLGRLAQELDRAAGGEEDLAWRIRGASAWSPRKLRSFSRAQREILSLVEENLGRLAPPAQSPAAGAGGDPLAGAADAGKRALEALRQAAQLLSLEDGAIPVDAARERALASASSGASSLSALPELLEAARGPSPRQMELLRQKLKARLGTLPERVSRLAESLRRRAEALHGLALQGPDPAAGPGRYREAEGQLGTHASESAALASAARREGARAGNDRRAAHDRAALELAAVAASDLPAVQRLLRNVQELAPTARQGALLEAASGVDRAGRRVAAVAQVLSAAEAEDVFASLGEELTRASARGDQPPEAAPDCSGITREAQLCLEATLRATQKLALEVQIHPRRRPLLDLLGRASELFRQAQERCAAGDAKTALAHLRAGRGALDEAATLARALRGEADAEGDAARQEAAGESGKGGEAGKPGSKEVAAAQAELEKLLEAERMEREISEKIADILRSQAPDPRELEALETKERELEESLGESFLTTRELVELVSKMVEIERAGRELAGAERELAVASGTETVPLEDLAARHNKAAEEASLLARSYETSGFKLSAVLPQVLKAYWAAGEALQPALEAMSRAREILRSGKRDSEAHLTASRRLEVFADRTSQVRRQALEAIADQERGQGGPNAGQMSLERARRNLRDAARLRREGQTQAAQASRRQSLRSIAEAAASLRAGLQELTLPSGPEGELISRVLDEEATRLGLGWTVATRGSSAVGAERITESEPVEMPFPAQFRDWVKVYLKALREVQP